MDLTAFHKLTYGLYLISASYEGKHAGCVVNTFAQVTASPIQVSVAINKENYTEELIEKSGCFTAAVLTQEADMGLIGKFGFQSSRDVDKFADYPTRMDENGVPFVTQDTAARFTCKVVNRVDIGTHILLIAEVQEAETLSGDEVLTYGYYQTVKKGGTPKKASSYQEPAAEAKKGWRCTVCGYVAELDELPDDYVCPICKQPKDKFVKL